MAARKRRLTLSDNWREKIQAGVIMSRLLGHVNGEVEMTPSQVAAAKILLGKIVPDVTKSEVDAKVSGSLGVALNVIGVPSGTAER